MGSSAARRLRRAEERGRARDRAASRAEPARSPAGRAKCHYNRGVAMLLAGRYGEAIESLLLADRLRPQHVATVVNLGAALFLDGRPDEAEVWLRRATRLDPNFAPTWNNLGNALARRGRHEEAVAAYDQAIRLDPRADGARFGRAESLLAMGDYLAGWTAFESRWAMPKYREYREQVRALPRWDGSPLDGRAVLLTGEQGFGDDFFFVRYASVLKRRGAGPVQLQCRGSLVPLLSRAAGVDRAHAGDDPRPFDVWAALPSLPGLCGTTVETIPWGGPYLSADPTRVDRWRPLVAGAGFRVGVSWHGDPTNPRRDRSFPLAALAPVASVAGVRLVSLQVGPGSERARSVGFPVAVPDGLDAEGGAFMDCAAAMASLDLVIACDSAVANLAGAMGRRAWVALPHAAEWRWMAPDRYPDSSPWYPHHRLFRQSSPGDWDPVFRRMADELRGLAACRS